VNIAIVSANVLTKEQSHPPPHNIRNKKLKRKQRTETSKHITTNPIAHSNELPPPKPNAFHQNFISKNEIHTQRAITKKNIDFQK